MKGLLAISAAMLLGLGSTALADDVEIYFNTSPGDAGAPLVMFSLDYRSNLGSNICNVATKEDGEGDFSDCSWTSDFPEFNKHFAFEHYDDGVIEFFDMLRAALKYVFTDEQLSKSNMRLGLMLNHDHVNNCANDPSPGCSNGGYIAMGLTPVTGGGIDGLHEKLDAMPVPSGNLSHSFQGKELYFELFRYLTGQGVYNGHVGFTDYGDPCKLDNLDSSPADLDGCTNDLDYPDIAWDTAIENSAGTQYISPLVDSLQCSSVHVLNFMFGVSSQDADSDTAIRAAKDGGGLAIELTGGTNNQFLQVIETLRNTDLADGTWGTAPDIGGNQNVTSHFVYNGNVGNTINGYALAGGGRSIEVTDDPRVLVEEIKNTFLSIIRQNSTFEAPAVTVNSYNRLAHRDEIFYALFAPELGRDWPGNLKKYKFNEVDLDLDGDGITDETRIMIVDRDGGLAIDADGLFDVAACSFWSDCLVEPDGDFVEKGGAAGRLEAVRNVYTYVGNAPSAASPVELSSGAYNKLHEDNTAITAEHLGISVDNVGNYDASKDLIVDDADVAAARTAVLRIGRGVDEFDETLPIKRIGDQIHSRPAVIIYDGDVTDADNDGVIEPTFAIALSTNEGYFHLIDADTGDEIFSFVPKELLPLLWKINKEAPTGSGGTRYDTYGLDASPVVLWKDVEQDDVIDATAGDRVIVYLTQRRGGRNLYALDITNRFAPKLLWQIQGGVTAGFEDLGQTWSEPALTKIRIPNPDGSPGSSLSDVLVFGGGYDEDRYDRDADDPDDGVNLGNAVFIVDALTGNKVWAIGSPTGAGTYDLALDALKDSVPAQVRVLDLADDGVMDRLYFSDVVGRLFRVDFDNSTGTTALHGGGRIATLTDTGACDPAVSPNSCRRFYNSPDVAIMTGYPVSPYVQVAIGSGFRAHPKDASTQDRFYVIYDQNVLNLIATEQYADTYGSSGFTEAVNLVDVTDIPDDSIYGTMEAELRGKLLAENIHGWYINMDQSIGEKVLSESLTIGGQIIFTTYIPINENAVNVCTLGLGGGRVYLINAFNGLPEATLGDGVFLSLEPNDGVKESHRYSALLREGMPTDPVIIFKEKSDGSIEPNLVIGTLMPLPPELLSVDVVRRTWWREE